MHKFAKSIDATVCFGRKYVNCNHRCLSSMLCVDNPTNFQLAILHPSSHSLNYARAQSTLLSNQSDDRFASDEVFGNPTPVPLADFLSQNASTSDPLAGQSDTFNAALAADKFELRFLLPIGQLESISEEYVKEMLETNDVELSHLEFGKPDAVLKVVCHQKNLKNTLERILPKITVKESHTDLLVHRANANRIKGTSGRRLKNIIKDFDLGKKDIRAFSRCCPNSTDRIIRMNVSLDKLPKLIEKLSSLMASIEGLQEPFSVLSYDPEIEARCAQSKPKPRLLYRDGVTLHSPMEEVPFDISFPTDLLPVIVGEDKSGVYRLCRLSGATLYIRKRSGFEEVSMLGVHSPFPRQLMYLAYLLKQSLEKSEIGKAYLSEWRKEFNQ